MREIHVVAKTLAETEALAKQIAEGAAGLGLPSLLIGLQGELGAGKTAFVKAFVRGLSPEAARSVTSPTFAIVQTYATSPPVTHMDLYRLATLDDLEAIGYRDFYFAPGVTLVEWIDRVPEAIPADWIELRMAVGAGEDRDIWVRPHGKLCDVVLLPDPGREKVG